MAVSPSSGQRVAAIDIGTNSILLTIAEATSGGARRTLVDVATITRLGEGVDRNHSLAPQAIERSLSCLRDYAERLSAHRVGYVDVVATSATRDADNAESFLGAAEQLLGTRPRVISGDEEARLTGLGAIDGLSVSGPILVFDVGGGSTEFVFARAGNEEFTVERALSLDIGSVRLTERHLAHDPPLPEELAALTATVELELDRARITRIPPTVIGVAGTVTTLMALHLGLERYDPERVHGARLDFASVARLRETLVTSSASFRARLAGIDPRRADVIHAGAVVVERILSRLGQPPLCVSDRGVRFGLLAERLGFGAAR